MTTVCVGFVFRCYARRTRADSRELPSRGGKGGIDLSRWLFSYALLSAIRAAGPAGAIYIALRRGSARSPARYRGEYIAAKQVRAPKERITRKISKKYGRHSSVYRSNITTPSNIVLPDAAERSTNGSSNTRYSRRRGEVRAIPFAAAFRVRSKKRGKKRERTRDSGSEKKKR